MHLSQSIPIFFFSALVHARTDLTGCTRTDVSSPAGASYAWIVPDTGELCDFLDCGGGRAPPKTTVPGCPLYVGTETYKPSLLAGFGAAVTASVTATTAGPTITSSAATATATVAVDDDTDTDDEGDVDDESDADDEGNTDDIDDFYDLMITYPADWNNWTPEQQANWWSSYGYNSAAAITATTSFTSGTSTSSQQSTAASSDSSVSSSTSKSAVSITNAAATSTTSTKDLPTLAAASTTSAVTTASLSMTRSASVSASGSTSASASLVDSTGAAGKVDCVFGGVGIVAAVIGVLAVF